MEVLTTRIVVVGDYLMKCNLPYSRLLITLGSPVS